MSYSLVMMSYASPVIMRKIGNKIEFVKEETGEGIKRKEKEEKMGKLEFSVWKLDTEPLYEIRISFNKDIIKQTGEEYVIKEITEQEMKDVCKSFKKLYEKIKPREGAGGGCIS